MSEPTPIIVVGAAGRMGRMILDCAGKSEKPFALVAAIDAPNAPVIGQRVGNVVPNAPDDVIFQSEMPSTCPEGTVAIVFCLPAGAMGYLAWAEATGNGLVIGTTGFDDKQLARIEEVSTKAPIMIAPNMSVGVNVLLELVARATRMLGESYDIEVVEMHHHDKKDSPSGTARRLAEVAHEQRGWSYADDTRHGREGDVGARPQKEIGMHAVRGGDVVGDHTVIFAGPGERIELTHKAHTRETFANGALRAASWLSGKAPGSYKMKDVLGL